MVAALNAEGAEVISVGGAPTDPKAMYTRDNAIAVSGGASRASRQRCHGIDHPAGGRRRTAIGR